MRLPAGWRHVVADSSLLQGTSFSLLPSQLRLQLGDALLLKNRPSTVSKQMAYWTRFQAFRQQLAMQAVPVDGVQIASWLLAERLRRGGHLAKATVSNMATAIRSILRLRGVTLTSRDESVITAVTGAAGTMDDLGHRVVRLPSGATNRQAVAVLPVHLHAIAAVVDTSVVDEVVGFAAMVVAFWCLLRVGEYCNPSFTWRCIGRSFDSAFIACPKTGPSTFVPIYGDAGGLLCPRRWLQLLWTRSSRTSSSPVFADATGAALTPRRFAMLLCTLAKRAGVLSGELVSPHGLRRGGATFYAQKGVPLLTLMRMGRWASVRSVLPYYAPSGSQILETVGTQLASTDI